jgi:hypothetical protein
MATRNVKPRTEIGRRISAAMALAGVNQGELGRLMEADGLGAHDPEQISQGRKEPQQVHLESMASHLGVPVEWFTAEDFGGWLASSPEFGATEVAERLEAIQALVQIGIANLDEGLGTQAELLSMVAQVRDVQASVLSRLERIERNLGETGTG